MEGAPSKPPPAWTAGAGIAQAVLRGVLEAPSVAVLVVVITFIGFGALARDVGLDLGQAAFIALSVFALPGQVVLVDQVAQGASLTVAAFAVALTAVRLLPMTVALMPHLKHGTTPRWAYYAVAHLVAITVWLEAMRRLPPLPRPLRLAYFAAFGTTVLILNVAATAVGYVGAAQLPEPVAAGMIFLSPIYFFISLMDGARTRTSLAALALGTVMGPLVFLLLPGLDLLVTGTVAGTAAYAIGRLGRRR